MGWLRLGTGYPYSDHGLGILQIPLFAVAKNISRNRHSEQSAQNSSSPPPNHPLRLEHATSSSPKRSRARRAMLRSVPWIVPGTTGATSALAVTVAVEAGEGESESEAREKGLKAMVRTVLQLCSYILATSSFLLVAMAST